MWSCEQVTSGRFGIVVAGQDVLVVAAGGLELQRQDLDLLFGALPQLLLVGDALRPGPSRRVRAARAGAGGGGAGAAPAAGRGGGAGCRCGRRRRRWLVRVGPRLRRRSAPGGGSGGGARRGGRGRTGRGARRPVRRARPGHPAPRAGAPGGAAGWRLAGGWLRWPAAGIDVDHRPDVEPRGLAEVAGLVAVVAGHGDDQVVAVDDDLGTGDAEAVDAGADDLLRLIQRFAGGREPSGVRAVSVTRVPPCRSMPSLGSACLSPVRNTSR